VVIGIDLLGLPVRATDPGHRLANHFFPGLLLDGGDGSAQTWLFQALAAQQQGQHVEALGAISTTPHRLGWNRL